MRRDVCWLSTSKGGRDCHFRFGRAGEGQVVGQSFTTGTDLQFADARLALYTAVAPADITSASVYLESDNAGVPGAILDTLVEQSPIGSPSIVTFDCALCLMLSAGSIHWIVAVAVPPIEAAWNWNSTDDNSGIAVNQIGSVTGPWVFTSGRIRGAFEVDGIAPSSRTWVARSARHGYSLAGLRASPQAGRRFERDAFDSVRASYTSQHQCR